MADAAKTIKVKLKQKNHNGEGQYYIGAGKYFGMDFKQVGEELVADVVEKDVESLIKAKKLIKLSAAAYKELVAEAESEDDE